MSLLFLLRLWRVLFVLACGAWGFAGRWGLGGCQCNVVKAEAGELPRGGGRKAKRDLCVKSGAAAVSVCGRCVWRYGV